jgi:hypothetical protein
VERHQEMYLSNGNLIEHTYLQPNAPHKESECKKCQCMNNAYACMDLPCLDKDKLTPSIIDFSTTPIMDYEWITTPSKLEEENLLSLVNI